MANKLSEAIKQFPTLIEAAQNEKCVLFVGSGLSVGAKYKSWEGLIQTLVEQAKKLPHARTQGIEDFEKEKDFFTLAEFARSALGPNQYAQILRNEYGRKTTPTAAHIAIAKTRYRGIITTNYDRLLGACRTFPRHVLSSQAKRAVW